jgi:hypothetical protein
VRSGRLGIPDRKAIPVRLVFKVLLVLLVWVVLSVPVALLAGKVLKALRENQEPLEPPVPLGRTGHPVYGAPRALRDQPVRRVHRPPAPQERKARREMWE